MGSGFKMLSTLRSALFSRIFTSSQIISRYISLSSSLLKSDDRRVLIASSPKKDEGTEGEKIVGMDTFSFMLKDMFPTDALPNKLFNNVPFSQIPICNIKVSKNNTILSITDPNGEVKLLRTCGIEGFKNTRKGTNIAAQATAITFGANALNKGFDMIRVRVKGLGPGRLSAVKGLQMAGLNIVSITDNTPVSWFPPRPRKRRKL